MSRFTPPHLGSPDHGLSASCFNDPISVRPWAWGGRVNRRRATHFEAAKLLILQVGKSSHTFPSRHVPRAAPTAWTTTAGSSHDAEALLTA
jgi:hypothetical protein